MSEIVYMRISTQNSMFTVPNEHAYVIQLHIMSMQPAIKAQRESENSNSKTLFYKDCSLGLVKSLSNN